MTPHDVGTICLRNLESRKIMLLETRILGFSIGNTGLKIQILDFRARGQGPVSPKSR